jgi:hypothetical protein
MANKTFEPFTIEITKKLDLSEADETARANFRGKSFDDEEALLEMVAGPGVVTSDIIITWGKFQQFPQRIPTRMFERPLESGAPLPSEGPVHTEEITRRYRIIPERPRTEPERRR